MPNAATSPATSTTARSSLARILTVPLRTRCCAAGSSAVCHVDENPTREFVPHDSGSVSELESCLDDAINNDAAFPRLPPNWTSCGPAKIDANDPDRTSRRDVGATCHRDRGGTFEKSEPSPSTIVGCV